MIILPVESSEGNGRKEKWRQSPADSYLFNHQMLTVPCRIRRKERKGYLLVYSYGGKLTDQGTCYRKNKFLKFIIYTLM